MLAKNATIFRITGPVSGLDEALKARPFMDLTPGMASGSGLVIASPDYGTFTRKASDFTEFRLRTDTKILPASVVNDATAEKAKEIEATQGYKPGRKQTKEIKEAVTLELLASAFVKTHITRGWFDSTGWLVIDTASASKAEAVLDALRSALDEFPVRFWRTKQVPESAMTLWVSTQEPPEGMTIDDRVKLADHDGGTVSVVNRDATSAEVIQLITEGGAVVSELALTLEDVASFVLANGTLKRLAYLDIQEEAKGDPLSQEEEANADLILSGDAVRKVVVALTAELGGLMEESA